MLKYKILKDAILRKKFKKKENLLRFCKFLYNNQYIINTRIKYKILNLLFYNRKLHTFKNRCLLTGRARGVLSTWKISRIQFRLLGNSGYIVGLSK